MSPVASVDIAAEPGHAAPHDLGTTEGVRRFADLIDGMMLVHGVMIRRLLVRDVDPRILADVLADIGHRYIDLSAQVEILPSEMGEGEAAGDDAGLL